MEITGPSGSLLDGNQHTFPDKTRNNYLITNAWSRVEYRAKTGRSVPTEEEVTSAENIARLFQEVRSLQFVIACGVLAHVAVAECQSLFGLQAVVAKVTHTSRQALGCPRREELEGRIQQWADSVVSQIVHSREVGAGKPIRHG
ncbi:hypothetical protein [Variovorax gossypii]